METKIVYHGLDSFEEIKPFLFRCKNCGAEVPSGIINISDHYTTCAGKEIYKAITQLADIFNNHKTTQNGTTN